MVHGMLAAAATGIGVGEVPAAVDTPAAADGAQFENLISQPATDADIARYGEPRMDVTPSGNAWKPMLDYMSSVARDMRAHIERPLATVNAEEFPQLQTLREIQNVAHDFMVAEMQMQFIGKGLQMANHGMQLLYQQQG